VAGLPVDLEGRLVVKLIEVESLHSQIV